MYVTTFVTETKWKQVTDQTDNTALTRTNTKQHITDVRKTVLHNTDIQG